MKPNGETLSTFLRHYASHYGNRETSVRRKPAEPHLEDGGIYRKRWWAKRYCTEPVSEVCEKVWV